MLAIKAVQCACIPPPLMFKRIEGGFRENLFGWFCALFAQVFAPSQLHLGHELTIGAGYHLNMSSANTTEDGKAQYDCERPSK